jgi:hypothetical protein
MAYKTKTPPKKASPKIVSRPSSSGASYKAPVKVVEEKKKESNSSIPYKTITLPKENPSILPRFGYTIPPSQLNKIQRETVQLECKDHSTDISKTYDAALSIAKRAGIDPLVLIKEHKNRRKYQTKLQKEYFGYGENENNEYNEYKETKEKCAISYRITLFSLILILFLFYMLHGARYGKKFI